MTRASNPTNEQYAFTLIELLVVIAIIAILAAILFPVFATAREKARQSACSSNMKQIGLAIVQYEQDYDETVPAGGDWHDNGCGWAGQIYPYVKSKKAFICPSDTGTAIPVTSYGYNMNFVYAGGSSTWNPPVGWLLSKFVSPAKTVMLFEMTNNGSATTTDVYNISGTQYVAGADIVPGGGIPFVGCSPVGDGLGLSYEPFGYAEQYNTTPKDQYATGYLLTDGWTRNAASQAVFASPLGRHSQGSNYVMADGHAKWFMPQAVMAGRDTSAGRCNETGNAFAYSPDCTAIQFAATFAVN
ncbi:MAG: DUF1559 domain-containing protein [Capsulimonadaceae bacterium]|nr:DUF1559 domain-containing protein [Capsulimonadaceae bacterium]